MAKPTTTWLRHLKLIKERIKPCNYSAYFAKNQHLWQ